MHNPLNQGKSFFYVYIAPATYLRFVVINGAMETTITMGIDSEEDVILPATLSIQAVREFASTIQNVLELLEHHARISS